MNRPFPPRTPPGNSVRVNGKIRAREVRIIGIDGRQVGIVPLADALNMARVHGVDLVEIAANANPPVCRIVDFGKYRYEQSKKEKESKKHQHANRVKEIQLSPVIDPHDFSVKLAHAIDFLCDEMKVKISLRFRGREMAHKEIGFDQVNKFIADLTPYAHPDSEPKLIGRGITVMLSPLPRAKRAKHPTRAEAPPGQHHEAAQADGPDKNRNQKPDVRPQPVQIQRPADAGSTASNEGFSNNPFSNIDLPTDQ